MKNFWACSLLLIFTACASSKITKSLDQLEEDFSHHVGFVLYDVADKEYLIEKNSKRYFTPASNTKIITFYTSLNVIGDSIPALYYREAGDSLIFWGSGDPSFLYDYLPYEIKTFSFLKNSTKPLYFSTGNYYSRKFGPGWSWSDYKWVYSSEKSPFPIYGNYYKVGKQDASPYLDINIPYFKRHFALGDSTNRGSITRAVDDNSVVYEPSPGRNEFRQSIPFSADPTTVANLLADTLHKPVNHINIPRAKDYQTIYSLPADSVYKEMMQTSDNFIAEQLLLVCSGILSDTLSSNLTIDWAQDSLLKNSPDPIIWRDGSGLSRYNLITPRSVVWLWEQLAEKVDRERLFELIAIGGKAGTIRNYYKADPPYIYGKTGTLSNNHLLSGFLITKKGKLLIFSFMNNNYPTESRPVKLEMEKILWEIHLNY